MHSPFSNSDARPTKTFILVGFAVLFAAYQMPQGIYDYIFPNRALWLLVSILFFPLAYAVARWQGGDGLGAFGMSIGKHSSWQLAIGLLFGITFSAAAVAVGAIAGLFEITAVVAFKRAIGPVLLLAFGSFFASASEDILTRGYIHRYTCRWRTPTFVLFSSAIFVLNHIYVLQRGFALWVFLFVLGAALAFPLRHTGSLWLTIGLHWGWNIAYHATNFMLTTHVVKPNSMSTWVSAACAALLLVTVLGTSLLFPSAQKERPAAKLSAG